MTKIANFLSNTSTPNRQLLTVGLLHSNIDLLIYCLPDAGGNIAFDVAANICPDDSPSILPVDLLNRRKGESLIFFF